MGGTPSGYGLDCGIGRSPLDGRPMSGLSWVSTSAGATPTPEPFRSLSGLSAETRSSPAQEEAAAIVFPPYWESFDRYRSSSPLDWQGVQLWPDVEGYYAAQAVQAAGAWGTPWSAAPSPEDLPMRLRATPPPPGLDSPLEGYMGVAADNSVGNLDSHAMTYGHDAHFLSNCGMIAPSDGPPGIPPTTTPPLDACTGRRRRRRGQNSAIKAAMPPTPTTPTPLKQQPPRRLWATDEQFIPQQILSQQAVAPTQAVRSAKRGEGRGRGAQDQQQSLLDLQEPLTKAYVALLSRSEEGSKHLQRVLIKGHPNLIKDVLDGIEAELPGLMCHTYGNYLCSAAFQACSVLQRRGMLDRALQHVRALAKDKRGTHALQSLIGFICTQDEQELLVQRLQGNLAELSCDCHGTHVVQRALLSLGGPFYEAVLHEVATSIYTMAHHPHGVAVLKKSISQTKPGTGQQLLLKAMSSNAESLVQGSYSNYAVQYAVDCWGAAACWPIVQALKGKLAHLSAQKFSSNVIERFLCLADEDGRAHILEEISDPSQARELMSTVYGHYVVISALRVASPQGIACLERAIAAGVCAIKDKRLRAKWKETLASCHDAPFLARPTA